MKSEENIKLRLTALNIDIKNCEEQLLKPQHKLVREELIDELHVIRIRKSVLEWVLEYYS